MGIFNRSGNNKSGPRELGEDELPSAISDQPTTPKQRRLWRGKSQQKVSEDVLGSDPTAETDLPAHPAQKKRGLFGRKKDKQETPTQTGATLERTSSSIEAGSSKGKKGKAKKEKPPPPPPPRILTEAEAAEAAENQRRAIDSIRNSHYNPESAIYNWEPAPADTGVSAAPNVNDGATSPASNTRAGKLKGMFKPGKKASSTPTRSTAAVSSSPQTPDDNADVITNTATPDKTGKFGGMFRRSKSKDKDRDDADTADFEQGHSTAAPTDSLTPARSKSVFKGSFGKFGKNSKAPQASPARSVASEGVQMSDQSPFRAQQQQDQQQQQQYQSPQASPQVDDMQQDFNTREYAPIYPNPIHSIGKAQLQTDRYDPAGLGASYTGDEPGSHR